MNAIGFSTEYKNTLIKRLEIQLAQLHHQKHNLDTEMRELKSKIQKGAHNLIPHQHSTEHRLMYNGREIDRTQKRLAAAKAGMW